MKRRGYSLIESILASFLLVFTFFLVSSLFNTGLQYSTRVESRLTMIAIAERHMAEIRLAAQGQTWPAPSDGPDLEHPAYNVKITSDAHTLYSPSTQLEAAFAGDKREMSRIARRYTVTVTGGRSAPFSLVAIVSEGSSANSTREWYLRPNYGVYDWVDRKCQVEITGTAPSQVGPDDEVLLQARALDANGKEIKDVFFHWQVEPDYSHTDPSTGDISESRRDGHSAVFRNRVRLRSGRRYPQNGYCLVMAYAKYNGALITGKTGSIRLHRPADYDEP